MESIQTIVFDIETRPSDTPPSPEDLKPPAQMKNAETIEKWRSDPANVDKAHAAEALNPFKGQILTISWIMDNELVRSVTDVDERKVLETFQEQLQDQFRARFSGNDHIVQPTWIAHNIKFDMGFLFLRLLKYDLDWLLRVTGEDPSQIRHACTMQTMAVMDKYKTFVSLDVSCRMFGIEGKLSGMDGSKVFPYFKAGKLDEIDEYCRQDTTATWMLAKKLRLVR